MERKKIAYYLNWSVIVMEVIAMMISIKSSGWKLFQYYTEDSNILAMISSIVFVIYFKQGKEISRSAQLFRYMAVCVLTVTFTVVLTILAPWVGMGIGSMAKGYLAFMFSGGMVFTHTLCPIVSFISFIYFEDNILNKKNTLFATIPTVLYAIVSTSCNVLRLWHGPYPFLYVYEQPIYMSLFWAFTIIMGGYLLALVVYFANNAFKKKHS